MIEDEHIILAGVLQEPHRFTDIKRLKAKAFEDKLNRLLFKFIRNYYRGRGDGAAPDLPLTQTLLQRASGKLSQKLLALTEEYEGYAEISKAEFRDALLATARRAKKTKVKKQAVKALEAALDGDFEDATEAMRAGVLAADQDDQDDAREDLRSEGAIAQERRRILTAPKQKSAGFNIGFPRIMKKVKFRRTELTVLAGYAGDGKTQFSKAIAYNANTLSGANILFVAMEMERAEMVTLFVSQHAASLDSRGVRWTDILDGTATSREKKLYLRALDDFQISEDDEQSSIESERGSLHIWAPRAQIDMDHFVDRAKAVNADSGLDIVVADYLELIEPAKEFGQYRLNIKGMCEQGKRLAREENLWLILNHQISRSGRDNAEKRQPPHYLLRDLGESSGVERAADHVLWIYSDESFKEEMEARSGIAKARKGSTMINGAHIFADFERSLLGPLGS